MTLQFTENYNRFTENFKSIHFYENETICSNIIVWILIDAQWTKMERDLNSSYVVLQIYVILTSCAPLFSHVK